MVNNIENLKMFKNDPYLENYKNDIQLRIDSYLQKRSELVGKKGKLSPIANFHDYYGFHKTRTGWVYRDWAPSADEVLLTGDFNNWDNQSHKLDRINENTWEIKIKGITSIPHNSKIKTIIRKEGINHYKIPMFINKVEQVHYENGRLDFFGIMNNPRRKYKFKNNFKIAKDFKPYIYEVHIGIAQEKEGIGTYKEFTKILPRIKKLGYNSIQIMAVASHAYYGSFGYHVTNYFAASHWFGDVEDLKMLIDEAHKLGLAVFMDVVHSHASKNVYDGINLYDTTEYQLFHAGSRGNHELWDSKLFDYEKVNTIRFLLSNLKYYLEEYNFDGFRFDGVTSMLYHNHGIGQAFVSYNDYFSMNTDIDAITYLTLANELVKEVKPNSVTIAEDVSGMPALCLPIKEGGVGFDYRFNMGIPDHWAKELDLDDHDWNINKMWHELTTRREDEKTISYVESHDQALVGDKTIMFKLSDAEMYWNMDITNSSHIINRAISLHKLITSVTLNTASNGFLNFIGNEFGHPEWIDFPSAQNNWSYKYAKRQWSLVDNQDLKYKWLNKFNEDSVKFSQDNDLLSVYPRLLIIHNEFKLLVFERNDLIFIYNFHPTRSYEGLVVPVLKEGSYQVVFSSDDNIYGGNDRIDKEYIYQSENIFGYDFESNIRIYSPSRTMMVLTKLK